MEKKRLLFYVSLVLFVCLLISVFSIFFDIGHFCDCESEYCSICEFYSEMRKSSGLALLTISLFFSFAILTVFANFIQYIFTFKISLVNLKVKLSD